MPAGLRAVVSYVEVEYQMSERHACRLMGLGRTTHRYRARKAERDSELRARSPRLIIRIRESFSSKLSYRRISISLTTCLTLGTSAATFCASCRCLAVLTVPLTVSTPFLALNLMCCLSKEVEINAAL